MGLGCVVLAAGYGSRFGENKLLADVGGTPMVERALQAVPAALFDAVVVVTQYEAVANLAKAYGFTPIINAHPEWGQSHSLHLGVQALAHCDGILFQVADQPDLRRESVASLVEFFLAHPDSIVGLSHQGQRGNPCLFPARFYPELLLVEGDRGGNMVIRAHEEDLLLYEVPANELLDVDTPEQLCSL